MGWLTANVYIDLKKMKNDQEALFWVGIICIPTVRNYCFGFKFWNPLENYYVKHYIIASYKSHHKPPILLKAITVPESKEYN